MSGTRRVALCVSTIAGMRAVARRRPRAEVRSLVGLVPTMGALHEGHLSLVRAARARERCGGASPSSSIPPSSAPGGLRQVPAGPGTRSGAWPERAGADLVFAPARREMYPPGHSTWVDVEGLTEGLCGRSRPGHFRGVCTVVAKLLQPLRARPGLLRAEGRSTTGGHQADGPRPQHGRGDRGLPDRARGGRPGHELPQRLPQPGSSGRRLRSCGRPCSSPRNRSQGANETPPSSKTPCAPSWMGPIWRGGVRGGGERGRSAARGDHRGRMPCCHSRAFRPDEADR